MKYINHYKSPLGEMLLAADDVGLTGLWFDGAKYYAAGLLAGAAKRELPVFYDTKKWLDIYFSGTEPDFIPDIHMSGSPFRMAVWEKLLLVPYGKTTTYGSLARDIARERGERRMSAQAVGGAVGHNRISIIIPCHRVIGANGSLTGYAGGTDRKLKLLELEGVDTKRLFVPKKEHSSVTKKNPPRREGF